MLTELGWDHKYESSFAPYKAQSLEPARVLAEHKERYIVRTASAEMPAEVTGRFMHEAEKPSDYPKTGDWVAVCVLQDEGKAMIQAVVPRRTCFSRMAAGQKTEEQVIAANIDTLFIVQGLDGNYNPMRLLRYCKAIEGTGIEPIVVLNKADLRPDSGALLEETIKLLAPVKVLLISAATGIGMETLTLFMEKGKTFAFTGSSGAGKSTIINAVAAETIAKTGEVRQADSRGRHVTVTRQLYMLGGHGMLIDTPGMRELGLWAGEGSDTADIVDEYALQCRFRDCTHTTEPGCAVREALDSGAIPQKVFASHQKLKREMEFNAAKVDEKAALERKKKERRFGKMVKDVLGTKARYKNR